MEDVSSLDVMSYLREWSSINVNNIDVIVGRVVFEDSLGLVPSNIVLFNTLPYGWEFIPFHHKGIKIFGDLLFDKSNMRPGKVSLYRGFVKKDYTEQYRSTSEISKTIVMRESYIFISKDIVLRIILGEKTFYEPEKLLSAIADSRNMDEENSTSIQGSIDDSFLPTQPYTSQISLPGIEIESPDLIKHFKEQYSFEYTKKVIPNGVITFMVVDMKDGKSVKENKDNVKYIINPSDDSSLVDMLNSLFNYIRIEKNNKRSISQENISYAKKIKR